MRVAMTVLAVVVILSLFFAPWVAVTPTDFLPDAIQQVLDIADAGLRRLAPAPIPGLLELAESVTILSPFRLLVTGFLNPWMWIVILLPLLVAMVTLALLLLGWAFGFEAARRWSAWAAACGAGLAMLLLVISLPTIEHLGFGGVYLARLGLALAGIHLVWGYWLTLVALLGLAIVGVLCLADQPRTPPKKPSFPTYGRGMPRNRR